MACISDDSIARIVEGNAVPDAELRHFDECRDCRDVAILLYGDASVGAFAELEHLGRYEVGELLGSGAMGMVFAGFDPTLRRKVALKVLRVAGNPVLRQRLLVEAQAMAQLRHPNIVAIHDIGNHHGEMFLAMEYVDGQTIGAWSKRSSRAEIVTAFCEMGAALAFAHAAGVIHGDVKPSNALVDRDGRVRLIDFGLSCRDAASVCGGTPGYIAPEQRRGAPPSAAADQYAFAVSLCECLTGERTLVPALAASLPVRLRQVLQVALAERPEDRYSSMAALVASLSD